MRQLEFIALLLIFILILKQYRYKTRPIKNINKFQTFPQLFETICHKYHKFPALKVRRNNKWITINYADYYNNCKSFANSLLTVRAKTVAIIGYNAPGWFFSHIGSMMVGVKTVGIYPSSQSKTCERLVNLIRPDVLVVQDKLQFNKFVKFIDESSIKIVVSYSDIIYRDNDFNLTVYDWNQFILLGKDYYRPGLVNDIATIIYTSGTSGQPKGAIITHDNIINITKLMINKIKNEDLLNLEMAKERFVSYLPLNHIAAQVLDIYLPIATASCVWICDKMAIKNTLIKTLNIAKPTIFAGVPRIWQKIMENIEDKYQKLDQQQKWIIFILGHITTYFDNQILTKIGLDQCKFAITMAAPLSQYVKNYFKNIGVYICDIYGMTETTGPITLSVPRKTKYKSVGQVLPGINVKVDRSNEILVKSSTVFANYYKDKSNTVISDNGWLHTGDLGYIDKDGFLFITGRKKDIIITSGGENVNPIEIEKRVKKSIPLIQDAVVIGDKRKYITLLITLKLDVTDNGDPTIIFTEEAKNIIKNIKSNTFTISDAIEDGKIKKYIDNGIKYVNSKALSNVQKIKKWTILPSIFQIGDELTPTLKLKRNSIVQKYSDHIHMLYK